MRERLGDRLPQFTDEDREMLLGSSDFFGLNHYTTMFAANSDPAAAQNNIAGNGGISEDQGVSLTLDPAWTLTAMDWAVVPWGCRNLLQWIDARYGKPTIYITENGFACADEMIDGEVDDTNTRLAYYKGYLSGCHEAIANGVDLKGYFAWSMFDNFEWAHGYGSRFGLNYVDYQTLKRTPKASAKWFASLIDSNKITS